MNNRLIHRGPDSDGFYMSQNQDIGLAMRRLAIQDVKGGIQPVFNEDKTIIAVFNGEIYNFKELRENLQKKSHVLNSHSDSEVIPHLFEEYGPDFIQKCNGMFAIAIYADNTLYLYRDRIGIKPLYFARTNSEFYFASEVHAITEIRPDLKDISLKSLEHYLTFGYVPEPDSIYSSIKKLLPGHYAIISDTSCEIKKYWFLENITPLTNDEDSLQEEFEELLFNAVKIRMISDVPLGAFLSGGLDSSAVVSLMNRCSNSVKTFSIGFSGDDYYDESGFSREVAECLRTEHYVYTVSEEYRKTLDRIIPFLDEPFSDSSTLPMFSLSEMTRKHVTVSLSGTGSDELLGGYKRYLLNQACLPFEIFPPASAIADKILKKFNVSRETKTGTALLYLKRMLPLAQLNNPQKYYFVQSVFNDSVRSELMKDSYESSPYTVFDRYYREYQTDSFLQMCQYTDIKTYLPGDLLVKEDRMTMAHSLESRVPFLDYRLAEFCMALPDNMKIRHMNGKYILKKAMQLEIPEKIISRPKHGFSAPVEKWFRTGLEKELRDLIYDKSSCCSKYLDCSFVETMISNHLTKKYDYSAQLWNLLILELWSRKEGL